MKIPIPRFNVINDRNLDQTLISKQLNANLLNEIKVVAKVLPFKVNTYVLEELIDWSNIPDDPIFQYVFPQREMLQPADFQSLSDLLAQDSTNQLKLTQMVADIRLKMNPHPSGQRELNRPLINGELFDGIQHKYKETILFFPAEGQTCHTYCNFCFRWQQFVPPQEHHFASTDVQQLILYLQQHQEVTDLLMTGGDPMVMNTQRLSRYLLPLLAPELAHVRTIRIGTKALAYWPYRFLGEDGDALLRLFERLINSGKHIAIMAHYDHWRELMPRAAVEAIKRLQRAGCVIRSQGPVFKKVNDNFQTWRKLLQEKVNLGIVPYYMFVERDTGPYDYYRLPLVKVLSIYQDCMSTLSGLAKTLRGPVMSTTMGKVEVQGIVNINQEKALVLRFLQARDPSWLQQPFFAKYDEQASWYTHLKPFNGHEQHFFEVKQHCMQEETLET